MRAVVYDRYGGPEVLRLADVPKPVPTDDEVLVRVRATTVNQTDCHMRRARPLFWRFMLGLRRPKRHVLGQEFAGEVEAVGVAVTRLPGGRPRVRHADGRPCRVRLRARGRHRRARARGYDVRGRGGRARRGVPGAAGNAGGGCAGRQEGPRVRRVRLVRHRVRTARAVLRSPRHRRLQHEECRPRALPRSRRGASTTRSEDFAPKGQACDVFIDAVGKRRSFLRNRRFLEPGGVFVPTDGLQNIALAPLASRFGKRRMRFRLQPAPEGRLAVRSSSSSRRGTTGRSSTASTRWSRPSTRTAMSTPGRRRGMSS